MRFIKISAVSLVVAMVGCGSTLPPKELVNARNTYQRAASGPATQQSPSELDDAKKALDAAERSFNDVGEKQPTPDRAYVAIRKSEFAESTARTMVLQKEREAAEREAQNIRDDQLRKAQSGLADMTSRLEKTQDQLAREKLAREEAEKKAAQAMADLQKIASVKQESRGMVITLSGSVLFPSNGSTLLPGAIVKLNDVADALIKGNPDANITVEGHTDSQGQHQYNMDLSKKRAEAVKTQLVSRGVAVDRITTVGIGPDRPIAENTSAEGRANNRRVEIIVEPPKR
jgi:outer membrane protein OmpA-like peptidoglycan-associated protein